MLPQRNRQVNVFSQKMPKVKITAFLKYCLLQICHVLCSVLNNDYHSLTKDPCLVFIQTEQIQVRMFFSSKMTPCCKYSQ